MTILTDKFHYHTIDTDELVTAANAYIDKTYAENKPLPESFFLSLSVLLSKANIEQKNGGPFGAVIVEYENGLDKNGEGQGKPKIIGVGANHVIPKNDPSAHAEMEAYRDAAKRKGYSDLYGAALYTSCECCPMCLAVANSSGIKKIIYVNTRRQAEEIGFSDKMQYDIFYLPRAQQMTSIDSLSEEPRQNILDKLNTNSAVILDNNGQVFATGNTDTSIDPTAAASLNAVISAVKKHSDQQKQAGDSTPIFCLPEGFTLISRDIPHPAGLMAADWARMLRQRDANIPDELSLDSRTPDATRIIHVTSNYEPLPVIDAQGKSHIRQDAQQTYQQPTLPDAERLINTQNCIDLEVQKEGKAVFDKWHIEINAGIQVRY